MTERAWIKAGEVAEMLGVSENTVRAWRQRSVGPPLYRFGGTVRYDRAEVEAWIAEQRQNNGCRPCGDAGTATSGIGGSSV